MAIKGLDLLKYASELITAEHVDGVELSLLPSEDERVKYQLKIIDTKSKQKFGLMADNKSDVKNLMPKLLTTLKELREETNV